MLHTIALDRGLLILTKPSRLLLLPEDLNDHAAAIAAALAEKLAPIVLGPMNATTGRKVVLEEFVDGVVTQSGTATHLALLDDARTIVLLTQALAVPIVLDVDNLTTFAITATDIVYPGMEA